MQKLVALLIDDDDAENGDMDEETDVNEVLKELTDILGRCEDNCQFFAAIKVCVSLAIRDVTLPFIVLSSLQRHDHPSLSSASQGYPAAMMYMTDSYIEENVRMLYQAAGILYVHEMNWM